MKETREEKNIAKFVNSSGYLLIRKGRGNEEVHVTGSFGDPVMELTMAFEMVEQILMRPGAINIFQNSADCKLMLRDALDICVDAAYSKLEKPEDNPNA